MRLTGRLFCNAVVVSVAASSSSLSSKSTVRNASVALCNYYTRCKLSKPISCRSSSGINYYYRSYSTLSAGLVQKQSTQACGGAFVKVNSWCGSFCQKSSNFFGAAAGHLNLVRLQSNKPEVFEEVATTGKGKGLPDNWGSKRRSRGKPIKIVIEMATDENIEEILAPLRAAVKEQVRYHDFKQ